MYTSSKTLTRTGLAVAVIAVLSACGGGGGGGGSNNSGGAETTPNVLRNVAAASNGGTVSTSSSSDASVVIDGDIDVARYWQADTDGDSILIEFENISDINNITIDASSLSSTDNFEIEMSVDGINYGALDIFYCSRLQFGSIFSCDLTTTAKYLRLTIEGNSDAIEVQEIAVEGLDSEFVGGTTPADLIGTWIGSCLPVEDDEYLRIQYELSDGAFDAEYNYYQDASCLMPVARKSQYHLSGLFSIGNNVSASGFSATEMNMVYTIEDDISVGFRDYNLIYVDGSTAYMGSVTPLDDISMPSLRPTTLDFDNPITKQ